MVLFSLIMLLVGFQLSGDSLSHEKEKINESLISEHVTYFDIHDLRFENAEPLTQVLDSAHFVALGELHNRTRLGELTQAMLLYFEPLGYNSFALETGPYSADKLKKLIQIGFPHFVCCGLTAKNQVHVELIKAKVLSRFNAVNCFYSFVGAIHKTQIFIEKRLHTYA
jgi:hypothetical protein